MKKLAAVAIILGIGWTGCMNADDASNEPFVTAPSTPSTAGSNTTSPSGTVSPALSDTVNALYNTDTVRSDSVHF